MRARSYPASIVFSAVRMTIWTAFSVRDGDGRPASGEHEPAAHLPDGAQWVTVTGSIVCTRLDVAEVFGLHAAGLARTIRTTRRFDEVNEAMKAVEAGDIDARVVFDMRVHDAS